MEQYFFSPFIPNKKKGNRYFEASYPSVFLGFNNLESHCLSSMNDLAPNVSSSSEWGITITTFSSVGQNERFWNHSGGTNQNVHNYFSGNHILTTDDNGQTYLKEDTRDIQKSYLSYWAFKGAGDARRSTDDRQTVYVDRFLFGTAQWRTFTL